jgi:tRNA threonylcarbamoyladenosine biosynthesis protein TsaB
MKNKNFLSIETSLNRIFLVLFFKENVFSVNKLTENSVEVELNIIINKILLKGKTKFSDLNCILVSLGPGSYTGSRVGLAAAKAISMSLDIPLLGYSNFEAIYFQAHINNFLLDNDEIGVVIKANKKELYYQQYGGKSNMEKSAINIVSFTEFNKKNKFPNKIIGNIKLELFFNNYTFCTPNKEALILVFKDVYKKFLEKKLINIEPFYVNGHYAKKNDRRK